MKKTSTFVCIFMTVVLGILLSSCEAKNYAVKNSTVKLDLNKTEDIMLKGESTLLTVKFTTGQPDQKLVWSSSSPETVKVQEGLLTAKNCGEAQIKVATEDGKIEKQCKITVCDAIVSAVYSEENQGFKVNRFDKVQDAIDAVDNGGTVIITMGKYSEDITVNKNITLLGRGKPQLRTLKTSAQIQLKIKDVDFYMQEYPKADCAQLFVGESCSIQLEKCNFTVDLKEQPPKSQEGGSGIYVGMLANKIAIEDCSFSNFNTAIYLDKNGADIDVVDNTLINCKYGIGLDIHDPSSKVPQNLKPSGVIKDNVFLEIQYKTLFYYVGDNYIGSFVFRDYTSSVPETEKAQSQMANN